MASYQAFAALDVQPSDLSEIEKKNLLEFEKGATRVMETGILDRLKKFGLVEQQSGRWALTARGRKFCRVYGGRG